MELDPIVLLAYVSVAVNIVTIIAAAIAYAIFRIRRRRRSAPAAGGAAGMSAAAQPFEPVFLKPYIPTAADAAPGASAKRDPKPAPQPE